MKANYLQTLRSRFSTLVPAVIAGISLLTALQVATAQTNPLSQSPLLSQSGSVQPNLVLMFDDSASMPAQFLYQYGGQQGVYGLDGPGSASNSASCSGTLSITTTCTYNPPGNTEYAQLSPDVNMVAYDPRVYYPPRVNADGVTLSALGTPTNNTFYVYFYKNGSSGLHVLWSGYPARPGSNPSYTISTAYPDPLTAGAYFNPSYQPTSTELATGAATNVVYPNAVSSSTKQLPLWANRIDCISSTTTCSLDEERQNYANWMKYHSNRLDLAKTGIGYAFQNVGGNFRLGWGLINTIQSGNLDSGVAPFEVADASNANMPNRVSFYNWLYARTGTVGGTPNRKALENVGKYYTRYDNKGPWADNPDTTSTSTSNPGGSTKDSTAKTCRRSYSMLVTDGYYNDSYSGPNSVTGFAASQPNADGISAVSYSGTDKAGNSISFSYDGPNNKVSYNNLITGYTTVNGTANLYKDTYSNTFADVAMYYWLSDLRPDLTDNVPVVAASSDGSMPANPSFWHNMTFFGVTLGVTGTLPQTSTVTANLTSGTANTDYAGNSVTGWPQPQSNAVSAIDDMWHATVNSHGRLLNANNAADVSNAMEHMLAQIISTTASESGVAASSTKLITGTRKYTPTYTSGSWVGNVIATSLNTSAVDTCTAWMISGTAPTVGVYPLPPCSPLVNPTAFNGIPAAASRNIYAWNGTTYGNFDASNTYVKGIVTPGIGLLGTQAQLINYIRGDQTYEDTSSAPVYYRQRSGLLGDIINSTPSFVRSGIDMGYANLPAGTYGQSSYKSTLTSWNARGEGILFAGANDGMLHGFRDLGDSGQAAGSEVFAFVPKAVMPNLNKLAKRSYSHQYYVDGTTNEVQGCLTSPQSSCTSWSDILLGSLGAGGQEVYAIDVTSLTPGSTMGLSASSILWEITTASTGYANLGNIVSTDIQSGLAMNGQWVAVFGNGYYGADGKAHLYVADLKTGALVADINTGVGPSNGLSGVTLVRDSNMRIIGAYAGDLLGNMWKFDLTASSQTNWAVGLGGSPLYAAGSTRPITAAPAIVANPNGGRVVTFGTGQLFTQVDLSSTTQQALYGVWDSVAFAYPMPSTPAGVVQSGTTYLQQQQNPTVNTGSTGTYVTTNANGSTSTVSFNAYSQTVSATVGWGVGTGTASSTNQRGWYMLLGSSASANSGERLVYPMAQIVGRLYYASTVAPKGTVVDPCAKVQNAQGWNYVIDILTGGPPVSDIYPGCKGCYVTGPVDTTGPPNIIAGGNSPDGTVQKFFSLIRTCTNADCSSGNGNPPPINVKCGAQTQACPPSANNVKRTWQQLFLR